MQLNVGIVGAGIGGLAAACLLHDRGHFVNLIERFERPQPVGSGLVIQPVGAVVLDQIGAGQQARAKGAAIHRMVGKEVEAGRTVLDVSYGAEPGLAIHRAQLYDALLSAAQRRGIPMTFGTEVIGCTNSWVEGSSGRLGPFDLIVDSSGARSLLSPLQARELPYGAIWGTVDWPSETSLPSDELSQRYRRAERMIGVMPIGAMPGDTKQKAAIFWSLPADEGYKTWRQAGLDAWHQEVAALWPDATSFVSQITHADQMTFAKYTHGTMPQVWSERTAYVGDAAHRASPQLGQGANMALLDAMALATALDRHPHHLTDALRAYGLGRRWHVWVYQAMSAAFTPQYQSDSLLLPVLRDRVLFPVSQVRPIPQVLTALVSGRLVPPLGSLGSSVV